MAAGKRHELKRPKVHPGGRDDPHLMRREGLWLTNGGRVVKPGYGEYAREDFSDIPLMGPVEIETGISVDEFSKRWSKAVSKWRRIERRRHKNAING